MNKQIKLSSAALIVTALIIGLMLLAPGIGPIYKKLQKEQTMLRAQLEIEKKNSMELRKGLALERVKYQDRINKSLARIDSLNKLMVEREARYQKQIRDLKKRTVKQLEDEAETIYREHADKHQ